MVVVLLAPAVLAGCTAFDGTTAPAGQSQLIAAADATADPPNFRSAIVAPALSLPLAALDVRAEQAWLKPREMMVATASQPVEWFLDVAHDDVRFLLVSDKIFVAPASAATGHSHAPETPDHEHPEARVRSGPADVGRLQAGVAPSALTLAVPGRYVFRSVSAEAAAASAPALGPELVVYVRADADGNATSQAFLVPDEAGGRFQPAVLDVRTGTTLLLWNQLESAVRVTESAYAAPVPAAPTATLTLTPADAGLYLLHAASFDASGVAAAGSDAFLVDFERPPRRLDVGPYEADFSAAPLEGDRRYRVVTTASYPVSLATIHLRVGSDAPDVGGVGPAPEVVARLVAAGVEVATRVFAAGEAEWTLPNLSAGDIALEVWPQDGVMIAVRVELGLDYQLPTPVEVDMARASGRVD